MLVYQAFRYELEPNNKQRTLIKKSCGVARFAWNWGLAQRFELLGTKTGKDRFTTAYTQNKALNALKNTEYLWMREVSKHASQMALQDLEDAVNVYVKNRDKGIHFPKFRKRGKNDGFEFSHYFPIKDNAIRLPRIGWVRTKESTAKLKGKIVKGVINKEADRWYCSLIVKVEREDIYHTDNEIIGIDLGIHRFATIVSNDKTEYLYAPKPLDKNIKKVKKLHRQLDRKKKGSKNRQKASVRLARYYKRTHDIRVDFIQKVTTELAKTKSVIVIENLNFRGLLRNKHLARSILDVGWGTFRRILRYKCVWYNSQLIEIGRFEPTSKPCSECGYINKNLKLNERKWICPSCGAKHDRDENAAKNIRNIGIKLLNTASSAGIQACGESIRPTFIKREAILIEAGNKLIF